MRAWSAAAWSSALLFTPIACGDSTPASSDDATSESDAGTEIGDESTTDEDGSSSGDETGCVDGTEGCPCYGNLTCNDGLECTDSNVCIPLDCVDGTEGCPCYGNGTCNAGLECDGTNLCQPEGTDTVADDTTGDGDGDGDTSGDGDGDGDMTGDGDTTGDGDGDCGDVPEDMICIPAGAFEMGTDFDMLFGYIVDASEQPGHMVTISTTFWLDETEVTAEAYTACWEAGECTPPAAPMDQSPFPTFNTPGKENHPITGVNWYQAVQYCEWAGKRLPTEAEWEYAARGTEGVYFPWGNDVPTCDHVIVDGCGTPGPGVVGSKPDGASLLGVMDLAGNVMEWVSDYYDAGYYYISPEVDPQGPAFGMSRSMRGAPYLAGIGAWLRSTARGANGPADSVSAIGMRCAQTIP